MRPECLYSSGMTFRQALDKTDVSECISHLLMVHRNHYHEPGYILSSEKIKNRYNNVIELLTDYIYVTEQKTIVFTYEPVSKTYKLTVDNIILRDWFRDNNYPYREIYNMRIEKPKTLCNEAVLVEVMYELTYYKFPGDE